MDFELDDDQRELQAAAADILTKECPPAYLRGVVEGDHEAEDLWTTLCGLDWPGLAIPEEDGGLGTTAVESAIVVEELGYVGDPTPFLATTTQFAPLVRRCATAAQRKRLLGAVVAGGSGTVAIADHTGAWDPGAPPIGATRSGDGWTLSGSASFVVDGDRAEEIAVVARADTGPEVFIVPAAEVTTERATSFDPALHVATVTFDGVTVDDDHRLGGDDVAAGVAAALDEATIGLATHMAGSCRRGLDMALEYVREREQFGVPIGSFQAVKHKAVDMYVAVERAGALALFAALTVAEDDDRRSVAASMAKAAAGDAQRIVVEHAIQLFGGIGFTWENDLHLYLRRAKAGELLFGGAAEHRARVARAVQASGGLEHWNDERGAASA
ncbi:MAG: acyl-CoA dehydrogenase family protein [Acidimicrobiales bacterium]|nr:acyl-CoA dehydrogenase family protein [Acidimicrobiales bacterium]